MGREESAWRWMACLPELVGLAKGEDDVLELCHERLGGMIHELQRPLVVWLRKRMFLGEPVGR